jgi:FMN reductase
MNLSIVGVGGTLRGDSSSAKALRVCLSHASAKGAQTRLFSGDALRTPLYDPQNPVLTETTADLIAALRGADGVILASPGYHGGVSGALKNLIDYTEEMASDPACYFDGRAVGCVASAAGWQASASTLAALRAIIHALRGWPTPLGVMINSSERIFDAEGVCVASTVAAGLMAMTDQVLEFAAMRALLRTHAAETAA